MDSKINTPTLDQLCINTLRFLAVDAVQNAGSGHPGLPLGAAPMAYVLWQHFLRHDPAQPHWPGRDRFVLSAGHGSALLYGLLHLSGYALDLADLEQFRQWGSRTPGHPERSHVPGVEVTTGPLGQGFANAVGLAMAERHLAARYNRAGHAPINHRTWVLARATATSWRESATRRRRWPATCGWASSTACTTTTTSRWPPERPLPSPKTGWRALPQWAGTPRWCTMATTWPRCATRCRRPRRTRSSPRSSPCART